MIYFFLIFIGKLEWHIIIARFFRINNKPSILHNKILGLFLILNKTYQLSDFSPVNCWRRPSRKSKNDFFLFLENEKVTLDAVCVEKQLCHWDFYVCRWLSKSTSFFWFITIKIEEKPSKNLLGLSTFAGYVIQTPFNILDSNFYIVCHPASNSYKGNRALVFFTRPRWKLGINHLLAASATVIIILSKT